MLKERDDGRRITSCMLAHRLKLIFNGEYFTDLAFSSKLTWDHNEKIKGKKRIRMQQIQKCCLFDSTYSSSSSKPVTCITQNATWLPTVQVWVCHATSWYCITKLPVANYAVYCIFPSGITWLDFVQLHLEPQEPLYNFCHICSRAVL